MSRTARLLSVLLSLVLLPLTVVGSLATPASAAGGITPLPSIPDTVGTSFWVTIPDRAGYTLDRYLYISPTADGSVTLSNADGTGSVTQNLTKGTIATMSFPNSFVSTATDGIENAGARVTSTVPVSIYGAAIRAASSTGFQALPDDALGTSYRVLAYPAGAGAASRLTVTGTTAGTTVTITPHTTIGSHPAGEAFTRTLNAGQTYQLSSSDGDVTGTTITSDHPVAVMGGHVCANVPVQYGYCNPLLQQLPPTASWGTDFVTSRFATRTKGDTYRILADQDATTVSINGTEVATLDAGQFYETVQPAGVTTAGRQAVVFKASKPVLVAQYGNGSSYDSTTGDPLMMLVTPVGQQLTSYTVATPAIISSNSEMTPYINVVVQTRDIGTLTLDGVAVPSSEFTTAAGTDYSVAQLRVATGQHTLKSVHQFGVQVYLWGFSDGLGFPGGSASAPIADANDPPTPSPLTSQGRGPRSVTVPVAEQQEVRLLDGVTLVDEVTVDDQGTYELDRTTGVITFTPVLGFSGAATPVTYRILDAWNQQADSTFTPTVDKPDAPTPSPLTSRQHGTQSVTPTLPQQGTLALLNSSGIATPSVVVDDQGTYTITDGTEITFTPVAGFAGAATPVTYQVTDAYGQSANSTYTPTALPPVPGPTALTSSGTGVAAQSASVSVPAGGSVTLLDGQTATTTVKIPGQGTYVLDPASGTITFTPVLGFADVATPVTYRVTDTFDQDGTSTYTPTVAKPAGPTAKALTSSGRGTQSVVLTLANGVSVSLLDAVGTATNRVAIPTGQYLLDASTSTISFVPDPGTSGRPTPVRYQLTDAYAQTAESTYAPDVLAAPVVPPAPPSDTGADVRVAKRVVVKPGKAGALTARCAVTAGTAKSCRVTLTARVHGHRTVIGRGVSKPSAPTTVRVKLNAVGRALAATPNGQRVTAQMTVKTANGKTLHDQTRTRIVARTMTLPRAVRFGGSSTTVRKSDRAYVRGVGRTAGPVKRVICTGYADSSGPRRINKALGLKRAKAACAALGLPGRVRVTTVSVGEDHPVASNRTAKGRASNRRATITLRY